MPDVSIWFLLVGGCICILGALGGIVAERQRLRFVIQDQAARNADLSRRLTDQERVVAGMAADNKALSSFLVVLPDVVRQLNSHMSQRGIPPLLASTLEHFFDPAQILIFLAQGKDELVLTHAKGQPDWMERGHKIKFGEGRIGLAAIHQRTMDRDDFQSDSLFRRSPSGVLDPPGLALDLVAPMVNESRTMGVLCVGAPASRHRDEKRMIKLVADLGSLALNNRHLIQRLQNVANRDSLTQLCTKRFLNLKLGELTHAAQNSHTPLSLVIFDIDHFKKYNDTFGHPAGDEILKQVAAILREHLRHDDIAARYGGEEFVAVLPHAGKEDAVRTAEKIRRAIEGHRFAAVAGSPSGPGRVTISGGVAQLMVDGESSQELLSAADQALYLAKERGRNRIVACHTRYLSDDSEEAESGLA
ncbi:MAG TPA: sensor domain-containing diguanylate cyclase [Candidatus Polarisedimenticolia bacterium]|nr:sensor domain-containing diguanylate cyclase [Candidatus Polarisedimenticolia bacterium]